MKTLYESILDDIDDQMNRGEDDVKNERVAPVSETFDELREMLQEG